ncbi:hypothetical protein [Phocicoccus pinnipedialis]|uniref:Uncharacterized protein n=1 Tax=Phocicoccus pinnipedialis TaxID=110845 RepID=A0A6V7R9E9_9BACL|nr:hypothetical protein [Jeotgalicoccus pinnipedialis]MBP1940215.1 hypothetical protein [Jeotgalicoccus pinnipedialis]CAD2074059.1 hypothetical protein JEOPIN946_00795 [Jeotgalicoccus pinnipedialis]
MKKIIVGILAIIFLGLLFLNFGLENKSRISNDAHPIPEEETELNKGEDISAHLTSEKQDAYILSDEDLNATYQELKELNEPLIVSVLLPGYYSDDFIKRLEETFNTDTITFKRVDIEGNTTNLDTLSYFDNSDVVIISALQIQDYNDEVLPQHNLNTVLKYYMDFYNKGMTAIILSEPNAHNHNNLENVLLTDQDYMTNNDFYFISNVDVESEMMFGEDEITLSEQVERQIQENIKKFLVK